ncbi:recombinase family protein [uncultured Ruminococcus sp.]|uniref:recombinase family protein n=1 Tax=uncultured Ruminococcus sp. TaxID=165186 RepID=UPI002620672E|nr:recombinase family protein [uncultured Ruminococcus sp.]
MKPNNDQITALYCRLSQEDAREGESLSIENQKKMLSEYAERNGFRNCHYYIDDGYSGVSSNRPDYQRMLNDVENELVGTVIVKDQSRLSRNYLEAGRLMELVFSAHDVRFIAITDGVDSANGINEMSGIKNYFNDFFARDTSKKIRAVQRAKGERGERVGTMTPYGYLKDADTKQLIPDPITAPIVHKIFELCAEGKGVRAICNYLYENKVETPGVYEFKTKGKTCKHPTLDTPYIWTQSTVRDMLSNRIYCGDTVNFSTYSKSNKLKKRLKNAPENMLIFENTHEPIVSRELFELVQKRYEGRKRPDRLGDVDKYAGYLYCADCGAKLYLHRGKNLKPENNCYQCGGYQAKGKNYCTVHSIKADVLDKLVLDGIKFMTDLARENPQEFYEIAVKSNMANAEKLRKESEVKRSKIESRIKELDSIMSCLYEDRALGKITSERYEKLASGYEKEQSEIKAELEILSIQLENMEYQDKAVQDFIENAKADLEMEELTPKLLKLFISRVEVYEKPEKHSKTCGNDVVIHYSFHSMHKPMPVLTPSKNRTFTQAVS